MKHTAKKYCADQRIVVHSRTEIPTSFASEEEEREWWATHELADDLLPDQKEIDCLTGQHYVLIRRLQTRDSEVRRHHSMATHHLFLGRPLRPRDASVCPLDIGGLIGG